MLEEVILAKLVHQVSSVIQLLYNYVDPNFIVPQIKKEQPVQKVDFLTFTTLLPSMTVHLVYLATTVKAMLY